MQKRRHASVVQLLAATNPVGLDLIVPAIPQLSKSFPQVGSQELFSYYLLGLGLGQIGGAFLLQRGLGRFLTWPACIIYVTAALSAVLAIDGVSLLTSRFVSGLASGSLYFICIWMIATENSKEEVSALYAKRNSTLLLAAGVVPVVSAGSVILIGWKSVFLLQAVYGIVCAAVLAQSAKIFRAESTKLVEFKLSGLGGIDAINIAGMMSFSLLLYVSLANLPAVLMTKGQDNTLVLSIAVISIAIAYRTGAVVRRRNPALSSRLFPAFVIFLFVLTLAAASACAQLDIYLYATLYLFAGLYQSGQASIVFTRPSLKQPLAIGILTSISLLISVLGIEMAHRFADWRVGLWTIVAFAIAVIAVGATINSAVDNQTIKTG